MARLKKSRKKDPTYRTEGKSRYPVERTFAVSVGASSEILVDVGKCLSAINHRLYRQGKVYTVKMQTPLVAPPGYGVTIKRIPDTWWMQKAWHLAKEARDDQLSQSTRKFGRWDDFRVGWDASYKQGTLPSNGDFTATWSADENLLSQIHDATTSQDHEFVVFGAARDASTNLYGIVEQYDQIANTPVQQPGGGGATDAYADAFADSGLVEAAGDIKAALGDNAPYDMDSFYAADDRGAVNLGSVGAMSSATDSRQSIVTDLPLGLFKVENATDSGLTLLITCMVGNYKGVKAIDF